METFIDANFRMYRIAENFRWVQIFAIFADRPENMNHKKMNQDRIDDVIERDGSLQSAAKIMSAL